MNPIDRLSGYLDAMERRLRWLAIARGAAVTALAALGLTVLAVLAANGFAFSGASVLGARLCLFLGLALAIAAALAIPVIRLNRRYAARRAERRYPRFEERLLTFAEKLEADPGDPFLPLLAGDALAVAQQAHPSGVARAAAFFGFSSAAIAAVLALVWLGTSGPGFLGYGTSLLWAGLPKGAAAPYYAIRVDPGNRTIRKRADQSISAQLTGFTAPRVRFFARYASASKWEQAEMRTQAGGSSYQFLIAGVSESLDYYVEAAGVRSPAYKLTVVDLPSVKNIRVTYRYPGWTGMKDAVEDPGGDLRAVEGTGGVVEVEASGPLPNGVLMLDDGSRIGLRADSGGKPAATVPILKDGMYHVASIEGGEDVRLSEDYFIEAIKPRPPEVKIARPGGDFRASPIEEVTVAVDARDDFGLKSVDLRYSVNGAPEQSVSLLQSKDGKTSSASSTLALEDFKLVPGDIVSLYAVAKGARQTSNSDMFFIEAQPFERNYSQSQQAGGGSAGGDDPADQQGQISKRQKEIVTATWNQAKGQGAKGTDAENAAFLSQVQSKLRDQATSLAERMKVRQLQQAGDAFKSFVDDMEKAAAEMSPAAASLKGAKWQDALAPEQRALQYLLRAEATFRDIQVAFGGQGGGRGGGAGGATRDLEGLFDLELDTEKNQYEGARQNQPAEQRQQQVDDAMQKLQQLARRQQELAEQQRRNAQQTAQQRWQQEQLRREAEQLRQQMEQLQQGGQQQSSQQQGGQQSSGQQQSGQQQGGQQSSGQQQGGAQGRQSDADRLSQMAQGQAGQTGQPQQSGRLRNADAAVLNKAIEQLRQSVDDMRNANSSMRAGSPEAQEAQRRAADRLKEAGQLIAGMKGQQAAGQVDDVARQAGDLARQQQEFEGQMRRTFASERSPDRQQAGQLADAQEKELAGLKKLEQDMQDAARDLQSTERQASARMRDALGNMQQRELTRDMQRNSEWIRRGLGAYAVMSESEITAGLNQLRDELQKVQQALGAGRNKPGADDKTVEAALDRLQQLRQMLQAAQPGAESQRGQARSGPGGSLPNPGGAWDGQGFGQFYRDTLEDLGQLQRQLKDDPETGRDIQNALRDLRPLDPAHYTNDPLLAERIQAAMASVEQVELELRRMVEASGAGGTVRSPGNQPVPEGYLDAVAEYYRRLSRAGKQ
jgi:hypothetical protein